MTNRLFEDLKDYIRKNLTRKNYTIGYIRALMDYQVIFDNQGSILFDIVNKEENK